VRVQRRRAGGGDQIVFSRIRYRINGGLKRDTDYRITHPYGTDTVHTDPGETSFFVTQDVGVSPGDFNAALKGRVGPFLQWAPNPANPGAPTPTGRTATSLFSAATGTHISPHPATRGEGPAS
jgi:hypothetical protein